MITVAWYLLKVIVCSGILYGYYFLALRNKVFHRWNRFYLLATIVISLVVPVMKINFFAAKQDKGTVIQMLQTISYGNEAVIEYSRHNGFQLTTENLTEASYLLISAIFLFIFFLSLYKIITLKNKFPETKFKDISFIETDAKGTPFSFFKNIFWNKAIDIHSSSGQQIFNHEIAHIKEKDSYDKIFMNLILIFFWINPFFWLIQKELYMIHEFVADKEALEDSDISSFAEMILQTVYPGQKFSLTNNFFYSPLKRRLLMLTKKTNPKVSYISRLLVLPLAAVVFFAFTLKVKNNSADFYHGKRITVIIDAGHGGDDDGAVFNGIKEKDINLSIAKKIAQLNSNPNIEILLSRKDDYPLAVKERVEFAKSNNADLFISVHVNVAADKQLNGFSVLTDEKNGKQNLLLGSILISQLKETYKTEDHIGTRTNGIWVVDHNVCPAALVQCGYLSNPSDAAFITNSADQDKIARNILDAINVYAASEENDNEKSSVINSSDTIPSNTLTGGVYIDTHNKIILHADKLIHITPPEKTKVNTMTAVIVINGKIEPNSILKTKTIHAGTLTIHSGDEKDMLGKYGEKAKNGVFILDNATIKNEKPIWPEGGKPSKASDKVFTKVENEASFPGGQNAWFKYISGAITDSISKFTEADYGTCVVKFIVNIDGSVSDGVATTMKGTELAKVSINAIKNGPKWIPASQNGHTVAAYRLQPITLTRPDKKALSSQNESIQKPTSTNAIKNDNEAIFTKLEKTASFPGGESAWLKYITDIIQKNANELTTEKNSQGVCKVRFIVGKDGKVSDVQAVTKQDSKLAEVAVNAIENGPRWVPGMQNGHVVNSYVVQPVSFAVNDELTPKGAPLKVIHLP